MLFKSVINWLRPIYTGVVIASHDMFAQRLAISKCQHDMTSFLLAMHTKRNTSVAIRNAKHCLAIQHKSIQGKNHNKTRTGDCKTGFVFVSAATKCY